MFIYLSKLYPAANGRIFTFSRRHRAALLRRAGAPHAVAVDGTTAPRDAEPRGAHEGPFRHHAAAVPLLVTAPQRLRWDSYGDQLFQPGHN